MNDVLERLLEGNRRFSLGQALRPDGGVARRHQVAHAQQPFALIFSCSDSRVPPEIIFDCGLGDLFVIRTAGHTIDQAVRESILFGIQVLRIPLMMVLGHARCGAVSAAIQKKRTGAGEANAAWIAEQIAPAVEQCLGEEDLLRCAVKTHVQMTVGRMKNLFLTVADSVPVLGAYYDLDTGLVELIKT